MCNSPFSYTIFCLAAQICAAHALVGQQFSTGALHDHTARLKNVGTVCHGKSHLCVARKTAGDATQKNNL